jgi:predicted amidohydrolase
MARIVRVGLVQFVPERWGVESNSKRLVSILESAGENEFDLIVTPECIMDGYTAAEAPSDPSKDWGDRERWLETCALASDGGKIREVGRQARRMGTYLVVGFTENLGGGQAANAAGVFDRQGSRIATYRKTHLQNHDLQFVPGSGWTIVKADFGSFGVLICADRRWPEAVRCQRLMGAELLANPTYGMHHDLNLAMMRTRAFENNFFIVFSHPKQSLVTGPGGEVEVNVSSEDDALVRHTIDLDRVNLSHIQDRRSDLYDACGSS